ncbi:MAG: Fic family protein [Clostridiales bacterium]|nr:Fic family protein [Clostridiales bacterium]
MVYINDITEKRGLLYSLAPFSEGVKALKHRTDIVDFAYSNLRLYGSALTREGVGSILDGITVPSAPVFEHRLCEAHRKLLTRFDSKLDMDLDVDAILLNEICAILSGAELPPYREGTPLLYHLDFVPGDDDSISADLEHMFSRLRCAYKDGAYGEGEERDFCLKAAAVHMGIVKAYPYKDGFTELTARAAMQYELVRAGYFPVDIGVSETDYNTVTATAIRTGNAEELAALLRTAIFKKLHFLIDAAERGV